MNGLPAFRSLVLACVSSSLVLCAAPKPAAAEDARLGVDLFQSGRQMMNEGNYEKACTLLRDSQKADPQPGTQLNLALCYEKLGKTASAWSTYSDLTQSGGPLQQKAAKAAIDRLGPKLSRLKVDVCATPNFDSSKLTVRRNGEELGSSALGRPSPVDRGDYQIEARVPGFETWSRTVKVSGEADLASVEVCRLVPEPAPVALPPAASRKSSAAAGGLMSAASTDAQPHRDRTWAYVAFGSSAAALVVGTVFGVAAANKKSEANDACSSKRCSAEGLEQVNSAKTSADVATVSLVIAGLAAGVGAYLFFKPAAGDASHRSLRFSRVGLQAAPAGLTVSYGGAF